VKLKDEAGLCEVSAMWRMNFPLTSSFTLQPLVYGRILMGDVVPLGLNNVIGGEWFGHYVEHQLPFPGMGHFEIIDHKFVAAQLQGQYHLTSSHILRLRLAAAQQGEVYKDLFKTRMLFGTSLSYYYDTMFGPVGTTIGYSTKSKDFYIFFNLGFEF